jgi:ketosteroid isomerase-like protein
VSARNVEIARRAFEALGRGDLAGALADATADFTFDFSRSRSPERGIYARQDLSRLRDRWDGVWESVSRRPEEFIDTGDQVVMPFTTNERGRDGIELETRVAWLWSFKDGQIAQVTFFQDRREALEAAGLPE